MLARLLILGSLAADGEILIMPPTGGEAGRRNSALTAQLDRWCEPDGGGVSFDSSIGFILPAAPSALPTRPG